MKRPLGRYGIVSGMMMMERLEIDHRRERHVLFSRQGSERRAGPLREPPLYRPVALQIVNIEAGIKPGSEAMAAKIFSVNLPVAIYTPSYKNSELRA